MTSPKLLVPLRIPELGPSLGKLVTGTGHRAGPIPIDEYRLRMVTRVIDAAGEARRLAAKEERGAALAALSPQVWLDAWEEVVGAVTETLREHVNARLEAEAIAVRMPTRLRLQLLLDPTEVRALGGRLGAAGAAFVPALDAIEAQAGRLLDATVRDRHQLDEWQEALSLTARRLEAAWIALEEQIEIELLRWEALAERIARWRRPVWPVVAVGIPLVALAVWFGLVLGGYVQSPRWLEQVWQAIS